MVMRTDLGSILRGPYGMPAYCAMLTMASNPDDYPECNERTGGAEPISSTGATTLQIPGIYSDPGGFISQQAELLRLSMGGEPRANSFGAVGPQGPKTLLADPNTIWLLAAVAVAVIVIARRNG